MNDFEKLKFILELLNLMCDEIQDYEYRSHNAENVKRLHYCYENLSKAYVYAEPIIERGNDI